jgi:hypothetical protein
VEAVLLRGMPVRGRGILLWTGMRLGAQEQA